MLDRYPDRDCVRSPVYSPTKGKWPFTLATPFKRGASGALWLPEAHKAFLEQNRGANQVPNSDFSDGTTGWTAFNAVISESGEQLTVDDSANAGSWSSAVANAGTEAGDWVLVTLNIVSSTGQAGFGFGADNSSVPDQQEQPNIVGVGVKTFITKIEGDYPYLFLATSGTTQTVYQYATVEKLPAGAQDAILYTDSAGTTPVTADSDDVGLFLESSKWRGQTLSEYLAGQPELVSNGSDPVDTTGWTPNSTTHQATGGRLEITAIGTGFVSDYQLISGLTSGAWYRIEGEVERVLGSAGTCGIYVYDNAPATTLLRQVVSTATGTASDSAFFQAPADGTVAVNLFLFGQADGDKASFNKISVKEVEGDHLYQTTDANRPVFKIGAGGEYFWRQNGTNEHLIVTPSGAFPSDCSLFWAINTSDTVGVLASDTTSGTKYVGAWNTGVDAGSLDSSAGSPSYSIDGAALGGSTRQAMAAGMAGGNNHVVEASNLDPSSWANLAIGYFENAATFRAAADFGAVVLIESGDFLDANRDKMGAELAGLLP